MVRKKNVHKLLFICLTLIVLFFHQIIFLDYLNFGKFHFDFQSTLSRLIFGKIWFFKNGLSVPWFTPHICCGLPFYADAESEYYSLTQLLFIIFKPLTSFKVLFFIYSLVAFFGSFLLIRKIFQLSYSASLVGSTLFLYNDFFIFHFMSGHFSFAPFIFIPIYFYYCCRAYDFKNDKIKSFFYLSIASLIFALLCHSGGSRILPIVMMSLFFMTMLHINKFNEPKIIIFIFLATFIGLMISSSKIYSALSFIWSMPRDSQPLYFNSLIDFFKTTLNMFFFIPYEDLYYNLSGSIWKLGMEEMSLNVSVIPVIIFLIYLRNIQNPFTKNKFSNISIYLSIVMILIIFLSSFSNTLIGNFIVNLPILNLDWVTIRMFSSLIIPICLVSSMMFDKINFKYLKSILILFLGIIVFQNFIFDKNELKKRFEHNLDNFINFEVNFENINDIKIDKITAEVGIDGSYQGRSSHESFLKNISTAFCYFPILGYNLENLKPIVKDLKYDKNFLAKLDNGNIIKIEEGNPLDLNNGSFNFVNPSCYINPKKNDCEKNFLFKQDNKQELINFLNYKKFNFNQLYVQIFFNYISVITLIFLIGFNLFYLTRIIFKKDKKKPQ